MRHRSFFSTRTFLLAIATVVSIGLGACGGSSATIDDMPEWIAVEPESESYLHGTGTAVSQRLQTALEKAEIRARGDIASTVEVRFQGMSKDFQEEAAGEYLQQFVQAQKEVVNQFLRGTQVRERKVLEEDSRYRAYVLMEMPIGKASKQLLSKLKKNEELFARFRASEAFEALQKEVKKYNRAKVDSTQ